MKKRVGIFSSILGGLLVCLIVFADTFVVNVATGRVQFPEENIGRQLVMEDGRKFEVFRRLRIAGIADAGAEYAVFKVRFRFKSFDPATNKILSMVPTPFLIGMKGFREKYWTIDETSGYFQGIYQWESRESAEKYPRSFIFKLMTSRSAKGTLSYEIVPGTDLSGYIEKRASNSSI